MESSLRGASTPAAWETWDGRNVDIDEEGVSIATDEYPTYDQDSAAVIDGNTIAAEDATSADEVTVVDVALAPCGDPYVLTDAGTLYRYDPGRERAERLACVWQATGKPRTICVTSDTIYVAGSEPAAVQAISRIALQTRWIATDGADDPIKLTRCDGVAYLLDGNSHRGAAAILRVCGGGRLEPVVQGLMAPRDLANGPEDYLYALDVLVGTRPDGPDEPVVRRFNPSSLSPDDPIAATDTVHVVPEAFRTWRSDKLLPPTCLAVGAAGELLVGTPGDWIDHHALFRYRPQNAAFERQPVVDTGCQVLAAPSRSEAPRAYAIDDDGTLHVLDGDYRTQWTVIGDADRPVLADTDRRTRSEDTVPAGRIVTRFEASDEAVEWHRIHLERGLAGTENEVRVRYATTNAHQPAPHTDEWDAPALETLAGLGTTYAERLEAAGVEDLADLADMSGAAVQAIVSVEELDVSVATVRDWQNDAQSRIDAGTPASDDVNAVDGIGAIYTARLHAGGVPTLGELVDASPRAIARVVSAGTLRVPLSRTTEWVRTARDQRPERPNYDHLEWTTITPSSPRDALFEDAIGRYCWVELTLFGTAKRSPTVSECRVEFPRDTYLDELPAIYRDDPDSAAFLKRYLSLFERIFTDVERSVESLPSLLDPHGVPGEPDHVAWLGEFLGMDVDGVWPAGAAREFVDRAPELYRMRGTRRGIRTALSIYLNHVDLPRPDWELALEREAAHLNRLVEADRITPAEAAEARETLGDLVAADPSPTVCIRSWSSLECADKGPAREFYKRLLGCEAGVLVLLHPRVPDTDIQALRRIVAAQTPAHTSVRTVGLDRRVQLAGTCEDGTADNGYHTYLGVNSTLSKRTFALDDAGLGEETILGSHEPAKRLDLGARLGADTHLSQ